MSINEFGELGRLWNGNFNSENVDGEKIQELHDYINTLYRSEAKHALYTPIVFDNQVLYEGNRKHEDQFRFDYIDVKDKTVVDLGCNNGYSSFTFAEKGAKKVLGIEKEPTIAKVAELVANVKNLPNVGFYQGMYQDYFRENSEEEFDIVVFTSETDYVGVCHVLDSFLDYQNCKIKVKTWYIEPINHTAEFKETSLIVEWGLKELSKYGDVEFLTHTDYQNRGLFKLEIKDELYYK